MANKSKKIGKSKSDAKSDTAVKGFKSEKEEELDLRSIVQDERTWKIVGVVSILWALFLFISFASYLFTWKQDQSIAQQGFSALFDEDKAALNLLGRLGAVVAHFFFFKTFGLASFLICTFFFVVGVNLLFRQKVFSIWRNLKYVTIGLTVLSVSLSFIFTNNLFPFGGAVGDMLNKQMEGAMGKFGTGAVLLLVAAGYFIWQFNPSFKWPVKTPAPEIDTADVENTEELLPVDSEETADEEADKNQFPVMATLTINDLYAGANKNGADAEATTTPFVLNAPVEEPVAELELVEKEELPIVEVEEEVNPPIELNSLVEEVPMAPASLPLGTTESLPIELKNEGELELEIKEGPELVDDPIDPVKAVENLPPYDPILDLRDYKYPTLDLLENHGSEKIVQDTNELENHKNQIIATLRNYAIEIQKISATIGPTVTLYEIVPAPGVRISRIKNLEDDIALSLAALGIRIIAPIPGKGTIGIEVPNIKKTVVGMKTLLSSEKFQNNNFSLPIAIGKKIDNENFIVDLASMPHLLMAGATGQGKSVGLNAILVSLLYKKHPSQLKFVLIDPKKVELSVYRHIEKHFLAKLPGEEDAIITDTKKVINTLNALCIEMDNRYDLLKDAGARNIKEYNEKFSKRKLNPEKGHQYLPFVVLVIDEFADLIMTAGKEVETPIARLAQLARAIGIHLIIATQRPSVNIITGTIKANFPARIAFKVSSKIDSRTILDAGGAEQLIGKGDMLVSYNGEITRLQCAFVDTPEVEQIVEFISEQRGYPHAFLLPEYVDEKDLEGKDFDLSERDSLFNDAARMIVQNQVGSTSLLQRRMKLGYNRAGRLMDQLEAAGIVGPSQGSRPRDVLVKTDAELQQLLDNMG
jgi:S-DNA-T family DNA segregation ATPase FtsK/SpoIIIE